MTKTQANVLIGVILVALIAGFVLYVQREEQQARFTEDQARCWTDDCVIAIGMKAADRLRGYGY